MGGKDVSDIPNWILYNVFLIGSNSRLLTLMTFCPEIQSVVGHFSGLLSAT